MSVSPIDFLIQSDQFSSPDYFEYSSPVRVSENAWNFSELVRKNPTPYAVKHSIKSKTRFDYLKNYTTDYLGIYKSLDSLASIGSSAYSAEKFHSDTSTYFPGVRYMTPGIIVFERPPSYQHLTISFDHRDELNDETPIKDYYIPIPWQVYIASYNPEDMRLFNVRMYFTSSTLFSVDQPIYAPPLFNFYSNGKLCRPFFPSIEDIEKYPQNVSGIIASAYDWIWNSGFNLDITENISEFLMTKKFTQFEKYLKTQEEKLSYSFLLSHSVTGIPRTLPSAYTNSLFTCWQSVPIEEISSFNWSIYTDADFFYQESLTQDQINSCLHDYLALHNLVIHEYEDHDYIEEEDEYDCPDNCISEENLYSSGSFKKFVSERTVPKPKSLKPAMLSAVKEIRSDDIAQKPLSILAFIKKFYDIALSS